jgi:hypothetical protein
MTDKLKLTREALDLINKVLTEKTNLVNLIDSLAPDRSLQFTRHLRKNEDGKSATAFIDLTEVEATVLRELLQARVDVINANINKLGLEIV